MVCLNREDAAGFILRQQNGLQLRLDFGTNLKSPPGGLKPNQMVHVVGILNAGDPRDSGSGIGLRLNLKP
jgi:hypothetical protein